MSRTGLTTRIAVATVIVLIPLGLAFWLLTTAAQDLHNATNARREAQQRELVAAQIEQRVGQVETALRGYALSLDPRFASDQSAAAAALPGLERALEQSVRRDSSSDADDRLGALFAPVNGYLKQYAAPLLADLRRDGRSAATAAVLLAGKRRLDDIRTRFAAFAKEEAAAVQRGAARADAAAQRTLVVGIVGVIGVPLLGLLATFLLSRHITRPIRRVGDAADRLRAGELDVRVEGGGTGEVAHLSDSFNAMAASMERSRDALQAQNAELETKRADLAKAVTSAERTARLNRGMLEAASDGYLAIDEDGIVLAYTPQAEKAFGYPEEEVLGRGLAELIFEPEGRDAHHARRRALLATGGRSEPYSVWVRRKDGQRVLIEISAAAVTTDAERIGVYFVRDVTDQVRRDEERQAEEAVSRALAQAGVGDDLVLPIMAAMATAFQYRHAAFWEYDEHALVLRCTHVWAQPGFGYPEVQRAVQDMPIPTSGWSDGIAPVLDAWRTGEPQWAVRENLAHEIQDVVRDAGPLQSGVVLPVTFAGEALGVLGFTTEEREAPDDTRWTALESITALVGQVMGRRRAEQQADRLKNEFFALLSHELRTPLTSVVGYLDLVRDEEAGPLNDEQREFLAIVERNAHRLMRLVGDLLFVAQIEAGKLTLELHSTDLEEVVRHGLQAARPRADVQQVALTAETVPLTIAAGDADRLGQLVDNLVSNAIKFTPAGGAVTVRLRRDGTDAVLEVTDDGPGISPDDQPYLFERFFRTESARRGAIPGLGLGLSISRAIADGHHGRLHLESTPGDGTTVRLVVPVGGP